MNDEEYCKLWKGITHGISFTNMNPDCGDRRLSKFSFLLDEMTARENLPLANTVGTVGQGFFRYAIARNAYTCVKETCMSCTGETCGNIVREEKGLE